ncbi:LPS-induced tumor necrosis factor alpha factor [Olea europaea subsp. europaea]|uniref:LPS-induced tumor necrosis factor alpha factor n=1 Tax=Olea europaea subsp. europaea TaxID=158383 RepID=A0A8S0SQD1_OLEEU|nr:LPS-induced tumor necrosis factor alpha factor [Olea europaea subsp. europaea]
MFGREVFRTSPRPLKRQAKLEPLGGDDDSMQATSEKSNLVVMEKSSKTEEPVIGIPYNAAYQAPMPQQYYVGENPYQSGAVPPNAVVGDPKGIPLQQTIYRDTPAPFNCVHCGSTGITSVK